MAGARKITFEQASAIKAMGSKGMKAGPIAVLMDCPQGIVEDILAGRTWRAGEQFCLDCKKKLRVDNRSGRCALCLKTRCCRCKGPLPRDRRSRRCQACLKQEREEYLAKGDRLCSKCQWPLFERRDHICARCRRGYHEERKLRQPKKPDGRKRRPLSGTCEVCRQPADANVCQSCRQLVNMWGSRPQQEFSRLE